MDNVKVGLTVAIPHHVFPDEPEPEGGVWMGKTVSTSQGGTGDIGISIPGEEIFTRSRAEVQHWLCDVNVLDGIPIYSSKAN